jgi:hypothetical protein
MEIGFGDDSGYVRNIPRLAILGFKVDTVVYKIRVAIKQSGLGGLIDYRLNNYRLNVFPWGLNRLGRSW